MAHKEIFLAALLVVFIIASLKIKKLTPLASALAAIIGIVVFLAADLKGVFLLLLFFILSVVATSHKKRLKAKYESGIGDPNGRTAGQVFANGGMSAIIATCTLIFPPQAPLFFTMMAASLASALGDTLSSELGTVYGSRFFNVLTFKKDLRGLDGVVSLEGTLIGFIGSLLVGLAFSGFNKIALLVALAGLAGNIMDSFLGAWLERSGRVGNNFVNFLSTFFAAVVMAFFYKAI
ncbi:uncharacterized protein (TIGR00297 family) [Pedobacter sp. UYP24]